MRTGLRIIIAQVQTFRMLAMPRGSRFGVKVGSDIPVTTDSLVYAKAEAARRKGQLIISL